MATAETTEALFDVVAHRPALKAAFKVFGSLWLLLFGKPLLDSVPNKCDTPVSFNTLTRFHPKCKVLVYSQVMLPQVPIHEYPP